MKQSVTRVVDFPIKEIKLAGFNPPVRTYPESLEQLKSQILAAGRVLSPVHIGLDNVLADGHRRVAISRELGYETVPAIISDDTPAEVLWVWLNAGSMNITPSQWFAAVFHGLPVDTANMPMSIRRRIERLIELLEPEQVANLIELGRSPTIIDTASFVARYCDREGDPVFLRQTIVWFTENQSQFSARRAIAEEAPPDLLIEAIQDNKPVRSYWDIG